MRKTPLPFPAATVVEVLAVAYSVVMERARRLPFPFAGQPPEQVQPPATPAATVSAGPLPLQRSESSVVGPINGGPAGRGHEAVGAARSSIAPHRLFSPELERRKKTAHLMDLRGRIL